MLVRVAFSSLRRAIFGVLGLSLGFLNSSLSASIFKIFEANLKIGTDAQRVFDFLLGSMVMAGCPPPFEGVTDMEDFERSFGNHLVLTDREKAGVAVGVNVVSDCFVGFPYNLVVVVLSSQPVHRDSFIKNFANRWKDHDEIIIREIAQNGFGHVSPVNRIYVGFWKWNRGFIKNLWCCWNKSLRKIVST